MSVRGFLPEQRARFEREARAVAALQHPRICTLLDVGVHDGTDYLVMEYLDGTTLQCPQPLDKIIEYGCQIADALDAASREGITHRDLKPANIIVTAGGVKLVDFGLAKSVDRDTITDPGRAIGTPAYMAPEHHSQVEPHTNRWIAYSSDDSGRREIYVKPFAPGTDDINFDVTADGQRFLLVEPADPAAVPPLLNQYDLAAHEGDREIDRQRMLGRKTNPRIRLDG